VIGGCSFEARNQRCFYIDFRRLHLRFQLCVASVNLPNPPVLYCFVHLEIEALNENIGRWETTWFTFIYCIYSVLIWWGTTSISDLGGVFVHLLWLFKRVVF